MPNEPVPAARSILLIHGACHGSWCWERVTPHLRDAGFAVRAVDLPARDGRRRPGWGPSLQDYARAVIDAASDMPGPVAAVAHSMGGMVLSAAAELAPDRFARLVYASAFLPLSGDSIASMSRHNAGSDIASATRVSLLKGTLAISGPDAGAVFYGDCRPELVAQSCARLVPESLRPSFQRVRLSQARFGRIPRSYIRLAQDRVLSLAFQDWMLARAPCQRVLTLEASHSPFLSMPDTLAQTIARALA